MKAEHEFFITLINSNYNKNCQNHLKIFHIFPKVEFCQLNFKIVIAYLFLITLIISQFQNLNINQKGQR